MAYTNPIKLIAFDLGGVLAYVDKSAAALMLGICPATANSVFFETRLFNALTLGSLSPQSYFAHASNKLNRSIDDVEKAFRQMVRPHTFSDELISSLKVPFTFWSNINVCHFEQIIHDSKIMHKHSTARGLSFELGCTKPQSEFFKLSLQKSRVDPSAIYFIDDREPNVAMAKRFKVNALYAANRDEIYASLNSANLLRN